MSLGNKLPLKKCQYIYIKQNCLIQKCLHYTKNSKYKNVYVSKWPEENISKYINGQRENKFNRNKNLV